MRCWPGPPRSPAIADWAADLDPPARRRDALVAIVEDMPKDLHKPVTTALRSLTATAGEIPENEWWLGWTNPDDTPPDDQP